MRWYLILSTSFCVFCYNILHWDALQCFVLQYDMCDPMSFDTCCSAVCCIEICYEWKSWHTLWYIMNWRVKYIIHVMWYITVKYSPPVSTWIEYRDSMEDERTVLHRLYWISVNRAALWFVSNTKTVSCWTQAQKPLNKSDVITVFPLEQHTLCPFSQAPWMM